MRTIEATVDIEASPEAVWAVLMDWAAYPSWNPFIRTITGKAKVGGRIHVRNRPASRKRADHRNGDAP